MNINFSKGSIEWIEKEFSEFKGMYIRLYPQYSGFGEKNKGYMLGMAIESPNLLGYEKEIGGVTFYIEESDVWFFKETKIDLEYNEKLDEIVVLYEEEIPNK